MEIRVWNFDSLEHVYDFLILRKNLFQLEITRDVPHVGLGSEALSVELIYEEALLHFHCIVVVELKHAILVHLRGKGIEMAKG